MVMADTNVFIDFWNKGVFCGTNRYRGKEVPFKE